jgi:hypothetical protein
MRRSKYCVGHISIEELGLNHDTRISESLTLPFRLVQATQKIYSFAHDSGRIIRMVGDLHSAFLEGLTDDPKLN